jgi:hypothetical protein
MESSASRRPVTGEIQSLGLDLLIIHDVKKLMEETALNI